MRIVKDPDSPWGQKIWFDEVEFESIGEEELARAGKEVFREGTGIDVEAILFKGRGIEPDYVILPQDILGQTRFSHDGKTEVKISRELSDGAEVVTGARHLFRTTLAHEAMHIAMHGSLHLKDSSTLSLFGQPEIPSPIIHCRKKTVEFVPPGARPHYDGQWWEYQANRGMSALLLPKSIFLPIIKLSLERYRFHTMPEAIASDKGTKIIQEFGTIFDVSTLVVIYRLKQLSIIPEKDQTILEITMK